jgi:hypothetical protein
MTLDKHLALEIGGIKRLLGSPGDAVGSQKVDVESHQELRDWMHALRQDTTSVCVLLYSLMLSSFDPSPLPSTVFQSHKAVRDAETTEHEMEKENAEDKGQREPSWCVKCTIISHQQTN